METILSAVIAGAVTLIGVLIANGKSQAVTDFGKISAATIARTAVLLLALTNQVLSALGKPMLPIESQTVEQLVTAGITTVAALISWWNNNSFTSAAIQADAEYARLKQKSE